MTLTHFSRFPRFPRQVGAPLCVALAAALSTGACGSGSQPAAAPQAESTQPAAESAQATSGSAPEAREKPSEDTPIPWKDMDHGQRAKYMKTVVLPKMKTEFAAFDAKAFSDVTCKTCHGPNAKDRDFKMPNPDLPKLDPTDDFKKHRKKTPETVEFMINEVVPNMAGLLGEAPYDPKTHQGFGCFDCHEKAN